jgi:hypothetical protein
MVLISLFDLIPTGTAPVFISDFYGLQVTGFMPGLTDENQPGPFNYLLIPK